jgi:hypothetical protein
MHTQLDYMQNCWGANFPPLSTPWRLPAWLLTAHTSDMMAYPVGGEAGRSAGTFVLVAAGVLLLGRSRQWSLLWLLLTPVGLTFLAAVLKSYPYGGAVRLNIYLAPAICLLAGLGLWELIQRLPDGPHRLRVATAALVTLALMGIGCAARDIARPYKSSADERGRAFARWFWFNAAYDGELACVLTDLKQEFTSNTHGEGNWTAEYLCNQRIYSPRHAGRRPVQWERVSSQHPLRCVVYRCESADFDLAARDRWLASMQDRYTLVGVEEFPFVRHDKRKDTNARPDALEIYKFLPTTEVSQRPDSRTRH